MPFCFAYTVTGDAVNVASRLLASLPLQNGTDIIVGEDALRAAAGVVSKEIAGSLQLDDSFHCAQQSVAGTCPGR
jgi:class 3 adenylate cyclase